jgi:LPS export ABC transporter protein LptC
MMRKIALAMAILLLSSACEEEATTPSASAEAFDLPADNVLIGVSSRMTTRGVVTAILEADSAFAFANSRPMELMGVKITFYTPQGVEHGTVTSTTGNYDVTSQVFTAHGNVVLVTDSPEGERRVESEDLAYDVRGDQIWTNSAFTLYEPGGRRTTGNSFRTDSKFQTWEITGAATTGTVQGGNTF